MYGVPERIHSDQGTQFESRLFQSLCAALHIEKSTTTPYHPQGNGKIERFNKSICTILRKLVLKRGDASNWHTLLPQALMAYRTMLSSITGFTLFKLVFGREMSTGVEFSTPFAETSFVPKDHLLSIIAKLEELDEYTREVMDAKFERVAHRLSGKAVRKFSHPGDIVRIRNHKMALTAPTKFAPGWSIPYLVLEVQGVKFKVKNSKTGTVSVINHYYLKHSASAKHKAEVNTKEAGSQTEVADIQRTVSAPNVTDGTKAKQETSSKS